MNPVPGAQEQCEIPSSSKGTPYSQLAPIYKSPAKSRVPQQKINFRTYKKHLFLYLLCVYRLCGSTQLCDSLLNMNMNHNTSTLAYWDVKFAMVVQNVYLLYACQKTNFTQQINKKLIQWWAPQVILIFYDPQRRVELGNPAWCRGMCVADAWQMLDNFLTLTPCHIRWQWITCSMSSSSNSDSALSLFIAFGDKNGPFCHRCWSWICPFDDSFLYKVAFDVSRSSLDLWSWPSNFKLIYFVS